MKNMWILLNSVSTCFYIIEIDQNNSKQGMNIEINEYLFICEEKTHKNKSLPQKHKILQFL